MEGQGSDGEAKEVELVRCTGLEMVADDNDWFTEAFTWRCRR